MGAIRSRSKALVKFCLTLIAVGAAMVLGSALAEICPLPLARLARADEPAGAATADDDSAADDDDSAADDEPFAGTAPDGPRSVILDDETWTEMERRLGDLPEAEDGGYGQQVLVFPINGTIDLGLSAFLERALQQSDGVRLVVLDINTFGGRVDAAVQMRDLLMQFEAPTLAYVHPRAISAGALISLSCDAIVIEPGGSIGAATPIQIEGGEATPVDKKFTSYLRGEFRSTAEAQGRDGKVAEAMVDAEVAVEGLVSDEELLTLDSDQAIEFGIADYRAKGLTAMLGALHLDRATRQETKISWAERMVRFLTDPIVGGLLMSIGMLGIAIELYTPGVGLPGAVGVTCLALFFFGHFMTHLAGLEEVVLMGIGVVLLLIEAFVTPGFGVIGIIGLITLSLGLVLALLGLDFRVALETGVLWNALLRVFASLGVTLMAFLAFLYFAPESRFASRLVLKEKIDGTVERERRRATPAGEDTLLGQIGVAVGDLRPSGIARFGDQRVDVVTEGDYVEKDTRVKVIEIKGNRVVVRPYFGD